MSQIVHLAFQGRDVEFKDDGWFNGTVAAASFGKLPHDWLRLPETVRYLDALNRKYGEISYLRTSRGNRGGTWMHPKLAVRFAQWLDVDFAIWCDEQIDALIRGNGDHRLARDETASSHKVMCHVLEAVRLSEGKDTSGFHYVNESKLVNWACGAGFEGLIRDQMTAGELKRLAQIQIQNAVMIGTGIPYAERKAVLEQQRELPPPGRTLPTRAAMKKLGKAA